MKPNDETKPPGWRGNYKRLKVAVRSFTEGFTGVLWSASEELANAAYTSRVSEYQIDFLAREISPPPMPAVSPDFFEYRNLDEWFDAVGSALHVVRRFQMNIRFDLESLEDFDFDYKSSKTMVFHANTEIEADNGSIYRYNHTSKVWFDFPPNPWRPTPDS